MRRRQAFAEGRSRPPHPSEEYTDMSDADLSEAYRLTFGAKPHHRMKRETIVERLNDAGGYRA